MDRVSFLESIDGINYPSMIVDFFDHFIALKHIVEASGKITVVCNNEESIVFSIIFDSEQAQYNALSSIQSSSINVYNRLISIDIEVVSSTEIKITLK